MPSRGLHARGSARGLALQESHSHVYLTTRSSSSPAWTASVTSSVTSSASTITSTTATKGAISTTASTASTVEAASAATTAAVSTRHGFLQLFYRLLWGCATEQFESNARQSIRTRLSRGKGRRLYAARSGVNQRQGCLCCTKNAVINFESSVRAPDCQFICEITRERRSKGAGGSDLNIIGLPSVTITGPT